MAKTPKGAQECEQARCSSGCEASSENKIVVEYLYLDLHTCGRCIGTDAVLDEVMLTLAPAFKLAGYKVEYHKIEMETAELAQRYEFVSSPTIRANGRDICDSVAENSCGCCGEISGADIDCRVFKYGGETYEVPPKEMLAAAILKSIFGAADNRPCGSYKLPDNLKAFYEGKAGKSACSCGGGCC